MEGRTILELSFVVKTTTELTPREADQLRRLFAEVFHKILPEDVFCRKYGRSCMGYSYHSLMIAEGNIVGAYSAIPVRYVFFGKPVVFAIAVELMVSAAYRGRLRHLKTMAEGLFEKLAAEGVAFVFGCARAEMRQLHEVVSNWRCAGRVYYYLAPLRLRYLGPMAGLLRWVVRAYNLVAAITAARGNGCHRGGSAIEKISDATFVTYRYGIFPVAYQVVPLPDEGWFVYTKEFYYPLEGVPSGIRLCLLLDVYPMTKENFDRATGLIIDREDRLEYLAYQGRLSFQPRDMFRVPERFEKKSWFLVGRVLRPDLVDDRIFKIAYWNLNLSNGDLI